MLHQKEKNFKLHGSQLYFLPVHKQFHRILVQLQSAHHIDVASLPGLPVLVEKPGIAAKLGIDPRHQLQRGKGLRHIVVRPDVEADDLVGLLGFRREHNDRKLIFFPQLHGHGNPVHPRHHDVHNRQVDLRLFCHFQSLYAILCLIYLISLASQKDLDPVPDLFVVLHHQDMKLTVRRLFHNSLSPLSFSAAPMDRR